MRIMLYEDNLGYWYEVSKTITGGYCYYPVGWKEQENLISRAFATKLPPKKWGMWFIGYL